MNNPLVIKLGGVLLSSDHAMEALFDFLSSYIQSNSRDVLILHGGGRLVDQMMIKLGYKINKINGLRQTLSHHIDVITGVLSGTVNKTLLSWSKRKNINSIGLCLSDGGSVIVKQLNQELGFVGKPEPGCSLFLNNILKNNFFPIISSIGITDSGDLMNVNADLAAAALAKTLNADLVLLSDVSAILNGKGKRIKSLNNIEAEYLIQQGIITNGMIIKVQTALNASYVLGKPIEIASWQNVSKLELLFNGISIGTRVLYN
ncbi:Acetylglutamate kinase [Buchnera aphidicola (Eriosoma grossulariae)]|uniref:acetylglutamate kinase n=1 Tax=Buchnera aphidicola TaxID=9 RepID=UPI0034643168